MAVVAPVALSGLKGMETRFGLAQGLSVALTHGVGRGNLRTELFWRRRWPMASYWLALEHSGVRPYAFRNILSTPGRPLAGCTGGGLSSVVLWCYVVPKSYTGRRRFPCATTSSAGTTPFAVGQL